MDAAEGSTVSAVFIVSLNNPPRLWKWQMLWFILGDVPAKVVWYTPETSKQTHPKPNQTNVSAACYLRMWWEPPVYAAKPLLICSRTAGFHLALPHLFLPVTYYLPFLISPAAASHSFVTWQAQFMSASHYCCCYFPISLVSPFQTPLHVYHLWIYQGAKRILEAVEKSSPPLEAIIFECILIVKVSSWLSHLKNWLSSHSHSTKATQ